MRIAPKRNGRTGVGGVLCNGDNATVGMIHRFQTYGADQDEADAAWNRAASPPPEQPVGSVEAGERARLLDAVERNWNHGPDELVDAILATRDKIAGMIALAGLGTTTGEPRKPHGEWKPENFEARIMDIIPTHVVNRIYDLTDAILAALSGQESRS